MTRRKTTKNAGARICNAVVVQLRYCEGREEEEEEKMKRQMRKEEQKKDIFQYDEEER
jgi:hypothetical protein